MFNTFDANQLRTNIQHRRDQERNARRYNEAQNRQNRVSHRQDRRNGFTRALSLFL